MAPRMVRWEKRRTGSGLLKISFGPVKLRREFYIVIVNLFFRAHDAIRRLRNSQKIMPAACQRSILFPITLMWGRMPIKWGAEPS